MFKKAIVLWISITALVLTGCGNQALVESSSYKEKYLPETDYNFLSYNVISNRQSMVQTEDGYYFIAGSYLFFWDSATGQSVPLCFKTDCLHNEETDQEKISYCDAFLGSEGNAAAFLAYYHDRLYTVCQDWSTGNSNLVEMKPDGSDRKILMPISIDHSPKSMFMHRGVIYFLSTMKNLEGESHYGLNAISVVSGSGEAVQVYSGTYEDGWIQEVLAYQNYIFFRDCYDTETSFDGRVMRYDIRTGETEEILGEGNAIYGAEGDGLLIRSDGQYYVYSPEEGTLTASRRNYDAFLEAHPQWQFQCEPFGEDLSLFSCYDLEADDFVLDAYVVNNQGETVAVIPDGGWTVFGSYVFEEDGEEYIIRHSSSFVDDYWIRAYAKSDLLQGIVDPVTMLEAESWKALSPAYLIYTGD